MSTCEWRQDRFFSASKNFDKEKQKENYLLTRIKMRKAENMDTRILVIGEGGIGKSYMALKIAELYQPETFVNDPQFAVDNQIHFSAAEYMKAITTLPDGSVIIYDEAGQSFNAREFMSECNLIITKTMIGYRFKHFLNLFCVPSISLIDRSARILCQYKVDVLKHGYAELQRVHPSRFNSDIWFPPIGDIHISLPDAKLRHLYDKKKQEIQDMLYKHYYSKLDVMDKKELTFNDIVRQVTDNIGQFWDYNKDRIAQTRIQSTFGVGTTKARAIADEVRIIREKNKEPEKS